MWKSLASFCLLLNTLFVVVSRLAVAGNTYYIDRDRTVANSPVVFGTIDAVGNKTPIGPGINWVPSEPPRLEAGPNGGLYIFDGGELGNSVTQLSAWGSIDPSTGVFTQIGNFDTVFTGADRGEAQLVIGFNAQGSLTATGIPNVLPNDNYQAIFGTYNLTTGEFQQTAARPGLTPYISPPGGDPAASGQIATIPNTLIAGGGPAAVGGASTSFANVSADGKFTSNFIEPTTPQALEEAVGALAAHQSNFGLSGDTIQLWELNFTGTFSGLATVTLHFDPALVGNFPLSELFVEHFHNGWVRPENQVVDTVNDTITFTTDSFSPFILGGANDGAAGRRLQRRWRR
jgi:hypothetical protein